MYQGTYMTVLKVAACKIHMKHYCRTETYPHMLWKYNFLHVDFTMSEVPMIFLLFFFLYVSCCLFSNLYKILSSGKIAFPEPHHWALVGSRIERTRL